VSTDGHVVMNNERSGRNSRNDKAEPGLAVVLPFRPNKGEPMTPMTTVGGSLYQLATQDGSPTRTVEPM